MTRARPGRHAQEQVGRNGFQLLCDPVFGGLFWGKLISGSGVWVHSVVAAIAVFAATGSTLGVGLVTIAQFAPQLLLTPLSGTWADRGFIHAQMLVGRCLCVLGSGGIGAWQLIRPAGEGWAHAWPVLAASLVVGLGFVIGGPAQQSVIPRLVTPDELAAAMTLNTAPMTFARVAGPGVGALAAGSVGVGEAFLIAASCHLCFLLILVWVRFPAGAPKVEGADYSVSAALRYVRAHRPLALALLATAAAGVGAEPTMTLAPALADRLEGGPGLVGALTVGFGLGAAAGIVTVGWVIERRSTPFAASVGLGLMATGMAVSAALPEVAPTVGGFALAGLGFSHAIASLSTLVQQQAPVEFRGRILAFWMVGFVGARPMAALCIGFLADWLTTRTAVALTAAFMLAATALCWPCRLRANHPSPKSCAGRS